jgi:hypothetical protein
MAKISSPKSTAARKSVLDFSCPLSRLGSLFNGEYIILGKIRRQTICQRNTLRGYVFPVETDASLAFK